MGALRALRCYEAEGVRALGGSLLMLASIILPSVVLSMWRSLAISREPALSEKVGWIIANLRFHGRLRYVDTRLTLRVGVAAIGSQCSKIQLGVHTAHAVRIVHALPCSCAPLQSWANPGLPRQLCTILLFIQ